MTTREDRDKAKSAREMLSKYFFSLSIATYTGAVMGTGKFSIEVQKFEGFQAL